MTPEAISLVVNDWLLHLLAGVLLALFAYLLGLRRAEKVSMSTKDCTTARETCREILTQKHESDVELQDQKLLRIEDRMKSLEGKVDKVCGKMDSLRGMVVDYFRQQGYIDRRDIDQKRDDGDSG